MVECLKREREKRIVYTCFTPNDWTNEQQQDCLFLLCWSKFQPFSWMNNCDNWTWKDPLCVLKAEERARTRERENWDIRQLCMRNIRGLSNVWIRISYTEWRNTHEHNRKSKSLVFMLGRFDCSRCVSCVCVFGPIVFLHLLIYHGESESPIPCIILFIVSTLHFSFSLCGCEPQIHHIPNIGRRQLSQM